MSKHDISPAPHGWTLLFASGALAVSLVSLWFTWANYNQNKKVNRTDLKPDVICSVRHSTLPQGSNAPYAAELVILNRGPIKAASVYASYQVFGVDTNLWWPYCDPSIQEPLHANYSIVTPELEVGEGKVKSILSLGPLAIYQVELSYYRPTDMKKFSESAIFLYDSEQYYDEIGFKQKPYYTMLKKNLQHRLAGQKGELPPGKLPPGDELAAQHFLLSVPDDNEVPRPLK
jgi:hypothetical protein